MLELTDAVKQDALLSLTRLCSFALLSVLSFSMAGLSWFLQMTYEKGMIFRKYNALITYWFWYKGRPWSKEVSLTDHAYWYQNASHYKTTHGRFRRVFYKRAWWSYLAKPLALCVYCQSPWVATFFYALGAWMLNVDINFALFLWPPYIGMVYVWVEVLKKYCK